MQYFYKIPKNNSGCYTPKNNISVKSESSNNHMH